LGRGNNGQVFNGQPDPNDGSHFWFDYDFDGSRGTFDGLLNDDGSVKLKVRNGPAIPDSPVPY